MNPRFLIAVPICWPLFVASRLVGGDAVAIGYNADGVWTALTYYRSATLKGGKDFRTSAQARDFAIRDVRKRSESNVATTHILSSSDSTGFVAVSRGQGKAGPGFLGVGPGKSQTEAGQKGFDPLQQARAGA